MAIFLKKQAPKVRWKDSRRLWLPSADDVWLEERCLAWTSKTPASGRDGLSGTIWLNEASPEMKKWVIVR